MPGYVLPIFLDKAHTGRVYPDPASRPVCCFLTSAERRFGRFCTVSSSVCHQFLCNRSWQAWPPYISSHKNIVWAGELPVLISPSTVTWCPRMSMADDLSGPYRLSLSAHGVLAPVALAPLVPLPPWSTLPHAPMILWCLVFPLPLWLLLLCWFFKLILLTQPWHVGSSKAQSWNTVFFTILPANKIPFTPRISLPTYTKMSHNKSILLPFLSPKWLSLVCNICVASNVTCTTFWINHCNQLR